MESPLNTSSSSTPQTPSRKAKSGMLTPASISQTKVSANSASSPVPPPMSTPRPFHRYSRRTLVSLSKSPLVGPPPGMPALKEWFGDYEPHISPRKNEDHHAGAGSGRNRGKRDAGEEDSRTPYKPQFSQNSQMGSFRHHSSRLEERETLTKLSEAYDRSKLLNSANSPRRDPVKSGIQTVARGEGDKDPSPTKDKDHKETSPWDRRETRAERSFDWRKGNTNIDDFTTSNDRRSAPKGEKPGGIRSQSRDPAEVSRDIVEARRRGARVIARGRSPSPSAAPSTADRYIPPRHNRRDSRRSTSRSRSGERDDPPFERRGKNDGRQRRRELDEQDRTLEDRRAVNTAARRLEHGVERERTRANRKDDVSPIRGEKEPAWMGDFGSESAIKDSDDIQEWKRGMREKDEDDGTRLSFPLPSTVGLDDLQLFKLRMKGMDTKQNTNNVLSSDVSGNALGPSLGDNSAVGDSSTPSPTPEISTLSNNANISTSEASLGPETSLALTSAPLVQDALSVAGIFGGIERDSIPRFSAGLLNSGTIGSSDSTLVGDHSSPPGAISATNHSMFVHHTTSNAGSSQLTIERTETPSAMTSQSAGKGSRFAKLWDHRSKDGSVQVSTPPSNVVGSGQGHGSWNGQSNGQSNVDHRTKPESALDGFTHLALNDQATSQQQHVRATQPTFANTSDGDRMQSLLSMLTQQNAPNVGHRPSDPEQGRARFVNDASSHYPTGTRIQQNSNATSLFHHHPAPLPSLSPEPDRGFVPDGLVPGLRPLHHREPLEDQAVPLSVRENLRNMTSPFLEDLSQQQLPEHPNWERPPNRNIALNMASNQAHGLPPRLAGFASSSNPLNDLQQSPNHLQHPSSQQQQIQQHFRRLNQAPTAIRPAYDDGIPGTFAITQSQNGQISVPGQGNDGLRGFNTPQALFTRSLQSLSPQDTLGAIVYRDGRASHPVSGSIGHAFQAASGEVQRELLLHQVHPSTSTAPNNPDFAESIRDTGFIQSYSRPMVVSSALPPSQHSHHHQLLQQLQSPSQSLSYSPSQPSQPPQPQYVNEQPSVGLISSFGRANMSNGMSDYTANLGPQAFTRGRGLGLGGTQPPRGQQDLMNLLMGGRQLHQGN